MPDSLPPLLKLEERYFERIWGGRGLERFGKPLPPDVSIGEAWLVADHPQCESVVTGGPREGATLRQLMQEDAAALLGTHAKPTPHGRFPLLLKLLDARAVLSVQVHPTDEDAARLGEPDAGKTEMWHIIDNDPGAELFVGLTPKTGRNDFESAMATGELEPLLVRVAARPGLSIHIPAGTVHAIGGGIMLAEIQQNSDITYRCFDWNRVDAQGNARELHIAKSLEVARFGEAPPAPSTPLAYDITGACVEVLTACTYFAAERLHVEGPCVRNTHGRSCHIVLALDGEFQVAAGDHTASIPPGEALLVTAEAGAFTAEGRGTLMDYYVPDIEMDIVARLSDAGHASVSIASVCHG